MMPARSLQQKELYMELMYSMGGEACRVYLDARVQYVIPGTLIAEKRPEIKVPILTLQYDLSSLEAVSAILGAMRAKEEEPEIYIWDEHTLEPEVAVFFRTKKPGKAVLDNVAGKVGTMLNENIATWGCEQAFTVAEVNLEQADVRTLIREYEAYQIIVVDIREFGQLLEDPPLARFVTRNLTRRKPRFEL